MRFDPDDDEELAGQPDLQGMLEEIDRMSSLLMQAGKAYGDDTWRRFDKDYQRTVRRLKRQLATLGIRSPFGVWPSLAAWKAAAKEHGDYDARDAYVRGRIEPVKQQLRRRIEDHAAGDVSSQLRSLDAATDSSMSVAAIRDHLLRLERSLDTDPSKMVSSAKNLVESTAKIVLAVHGEAVPERAKRGRGSDLGRLTNAAMHSLGIDAATEERLALEVSTSTVCRSVLTPPGPGGHTLVLVGVDTTLAGAQAERVRAD